jgi:uncharacterized protein
MLEDILIYLVIGMVAGTLSGMLGIGSGVIVVPALALVFVHENFSPAIIMHLAAGTSLASMVVTTSRALYGHLNRRMVVWPIYRRIFPGIIVGTVFGAIFAHYLHSSVLIIVFGVLVFLMGIKMLLPAPKRGDHPLPGVLGCSTTGFFIGAKSGLLGLGGGSVSIPFLTYFDTPMRQAVTVSCAVGLTVALVGTFSFILTGLHSSNLPHGSLGYVYWPAVLGIISGSVLFVPLGIKLSHALPTVILRRFFSIFLMIVSLHMFHVF